MADDQDQSQKTEEPTTRRLDEAAEKGEVTKSQDVSAWFGILGTILVITIFASGIAARLGQGLAIFLASPEDMPVDAGSVVMLAHRIGLFVAAILIPAFILQAVIALLGTVIQHRPIFSLDVLVPDLMRLVPTGGLKRIFSWTGLLETGKSMIKLTIVGGVAMRVLWPEFQKLPGATELGMGALLQLTLHLVLLFLTTVLSVMALIAAGDFVYQRWSFTRKMRMSKQELREEGKQSEGDPMVRARIRAIRMERGRRRMIAAVPKADVVVANPTHYAVALKYDGETMSAPTVLAKGQNLVALRIREIAEQNNIPVVENPPLARALFASCAIDQEIPVEHYRAVAEVISYVLKLKGRGRPSARRMSG